MECKSDSWKDKVDPAFDRFIKFYLEFLKVSELPGNKGYLALEERNLKTLEIEDFPSLASVYEHDKAEDALIDFGIILDEPITKDNLKEIDKEVKKKKNIFILMLELSEMMQKESRRYYEKAFENFISEETYNKYISGKDEMQIKTIVKKVSNDALSFWYHLLVVPLEDKKEEIRKNIQLRNFKFSTKMIKRNLFYTWDAVSLMVNGASLKELYKKAKEGDNESLFKLIQVDKTFFDHKWVRTRINKAAYSGDWNFFESLGEAIETDPLKHDSRKDRIDKLFLVIKFFWNIGLYRLSDNELHDLLISDSIYSELETHEDIESFQNFYKDIVLTFLNK